MYKYVFLDGVMLWCCGCFDGRKLYWSYVLVKSFSMEKRLFLILKKDLLALEG